MIRPNGTYSSIPQDGAVRTSQALVHRDPNGGIVVDAGGRDDKIDVNRGTDGGVIVGINGRRHGFSAAEVARGLTINGNGGDDQINVAKDVQGTFPLTITGGSGVNTLNNAANGARLSIGERGYATNTGDGAVVQGGDVASQVTNRSNGTEISSAGSVVIDSEGHFNSITGSNSVDALKSRGYGNTINARGGEDSLVIQGVANEVSGWGSKNGAISGFGNHAQLGGGNHQLGVTGVGNQVSSSGWGQIGVLGYGNVVNAPFSDVRGNPFANTLRGDPWGSFSPISWAFSLASKLFA